MRVPFMKGTAPKTACTRDHTADWDRLFQEQAHADSIAQANADSLSGPMLPDSVRVP
jgi:hypothetical protein